MPKKENCLFFKLFYILMYDFRFEMVVFVIHQMKEAFAGHMKSGYYTPIYNNIQYNHGGRCIKCFNQLLAKSVNIQ